MQEALPSSPDPDIARAVRDVLAGEHDAFAEIVRRYQDSVMTVLCVMLRDRRIAQEACADVFVRAFEHLRAYDISRPMKPWLVGIAHRVARNYLQESARHLSFSRRLAQTLPQASAQLDPLDMAARSERDRNLWKHVASLPDSERLAAVLFYRESLSLDETAQVMGVAPGTVKSLLFRAREHLRDMLGETRPEKDAV